MHHTSLRTHSYILRKRNLPNQDIALTLFSTDLGRVRVYAKGIKKLTSRRLPHIQTGNLVDVLMSKRNDRWYLQETTLVSGFGEVKKSKEKLSTIYTTLFILDRLLPEEVAEPQLFQALTKFYIQISQDEDKKNTEHLQTLLNHLLMNLGYISKKQPLYELYEVIEGLIHEKLPHDSI